MSYDAKYLKSLFFLQIHEFRDDLEKAIADQEFLRANELKEKIKEAENEKEKMQASVDSSGLHLLTSLLHKIRRCLLWN